MQQAAESSKDADAARLAAAASKAVPVQDKRTVQEASVGSSNARQKAAAAYAAQKQAATATIPQGLPAAAQAQGANQQQLQVAAPAAAVVAVPTEEQLAAAPRYGLNAKQLLLQAAAQASKQSQQRHTGSKQVGPRKQTPARQPVPPRRLNPMKLLDAIPFADRPFVQFVMRSNIPRLSRQGCSDTLLGQYLALLIQLCGLCPSMDTDKAVQVVKTSSLLREVAGAAAAAHELAVYREVSTKLAYNDKSSKAIATHQTLQQYGGTQLDRLLQQHGLNRDALEPKPVAPAAADSVSDEQQHVVGEGEDLFGEEEEQGEGEGGPDTLTDPADKADGEGDMSRVTVLGLDNLTQSSEMQNVCKDSTGAGAAITNGLALGTVNGSLGGGRAVHKVVLPPRLPDADDAAIQPQQSSFSGLTRTAGVKAVSLAANIGNSDDGTVRPEAQPAVIAQGQGRPHGVADPEGSSDMGSGEYEPGEGEELQPGGSQRPSKRAKLQMETSPLCSAQPQQQASGMASGKAEARQEGPNASAGGVGGRAAAAADAVAGQVAEFVKGLLDPLYRAQLLGKQAYSDIVRKAVPKIMSHHPGATTAAFLLKEHEQVRRYVMKLVEIATTSTAAASK